MRAFLKQWYQREAAKAHTQHQQDLLFALLQVLAIGAAVLLLNSCAKDAFTTMPATYQQATAPEQTAPVVVMPKKNSGTINLQVGAGNVATTTQAPKAAGPVVTGQGNQVTAPPAEHWPWWRWVLLGTLVGVALRWLVPWVWRWLIPRIRVLS